MITYLLDSDILIDFFKKKKFVVDLVVKLTKEGKTAASILSVAELRAGWTQGEADFFLPRFYKLFEIKEISTFVAEQAGTLRRKYKEKGRLYPLVDMLIAATVIDGGYYLVTRNIKDYPVSAIKLYKIPNATPGEVGSSLAGPDTLSLSTPGVE